jgi:hypothetical protein
MQDLLSRISFQSSMQISKKSVSTGDFEFNPFKYNLTDTALITLNTTLLNAVSFNRFNNNKWGLDLSNLRNSGKSLLTYGYESRKQTDWTFKIRWNISKVFTLVINNRKGLSALYTPAFENKNYELNIYSFEPRIDFINGTVFRLSTGYKLESKKNKEIYGGEKSRSNSVNLETKYNILQSSSVSGKFTFNDINYKTPSGVTTENSTVGYTILDGLLPGKNYIWNLTVTKRLLNNLELSIQYDGRKPATGKTVHVGKASLTALF